jgi:hypothetical protein
VFYGYFPKWQFKRNHLQSVLQLTVFATILMFNAVTLSRMCVSETLLCNIETQFLSSLSRTGAARDPFWLFQLTLSSMTVLGLI